MRFAWLLLLTACSTAPRPGEQTCYRRVEGGASLAFEQLVVVTRTDEGLTVEHTVDGPMVHMQGTFRGQVQGSEARVEGVMNGGPVPTQPMAVELTFGRGELSLVRPGGEAVLTEATCPS